MQILRGRGIVAGGIVAAAVLFGFSGFSWAKTVRTRVHAGLHSSLKTKSHPVTMTGESVIEGVMPEDTLPNEALDSNLMPDDVAASATPVSAPVADGKPYKLRMLNLHTGESLD